MPRKKHILIIEKGLHSIRFRLGGLALSKTITIGQKPLFKISPLKVDRNFLDQVLYPAEKPLPADAPVKSIEISFRKRR
jgi:hypothetical protein